MHVANVLSVIGIELRLGEQKDQCDSVGIELRLSEQTDQCDSVDIESSVTVLVLS